MSEIEAGGERGDVRTRRGLTAWLTLGVLGAGLAAAALMIAGFDALRAGTLGGLLVLLPVLSVVQARILEAEEMEIERMPAYLSSMVMLVLLGGLSWLVGARAGGSSALGLVALPVLPMLTWTGGLAALVLAVVVAFRVVGPRIGARESPVLRQLLPRSGREKATFTGVSVAAGLGEELAYRGLVLLSLVPLLGTAGAVLLSSVVFGVLHAYQGVLGMVRTGLMGAVLAWGALASGSLWPVILAHAAVDVVGGSWLGERLMVPDTESGV